MTEKFDIVGLGRAVLDLVAAIPRWPELDDKMHVDEFIYEGGGQVATALATAAKMGLKTAIVGIIGDDHFGELIREDLTKDGVNTAHLIGDPGTRSPFSFCLSDQETKKRTIFFVEKTGRGLAGSEVPRDLIANGKFLHLDGCFTTCAIKAARWAKEAGVKIMVDAEKWLNGMDMLLQHADYVIASERFCREWTHYPNPREGLIHLSKETKAFCGVTLGERGFTGVDNGEVFDIPSFIVETVDTLGAGDVFHGAFMVGILHGWDTRQSARFASAAAAMTCRELGGRKGIPTFDEVLEFMDR